MPVTDAEALRFVARYYGRRAAEVRVLGAGEWSRAYALVLDGREAVIRFGQHVGDFRKDQVMAAHRSAALPVPAVLEIGAAAEAIVLADEAGTAGAFTVLQTQGDHQGSARRCTFTATPRKPSMSWKAPTRCISRTTRRSAGRAASSTCPPTSRTPSSSSQTNQERS